MAGRPRASDSILPNGQQPVPANQLHDYQTTLRRICREITDNPDNCLNFLARFGLIANVKFCANAACGQQRMVLINRAKLSDGKRVSMCTCIIYKICFCLHCMHASRFTRFTVALPFVLGRKVHSRWQLFPTLAFAARDTS